MNIFFHTNQIALNDYHYNFKVGEYWRLPPRVHSTFTKTDEKHHIQLCDNFSYNICATVKHIVTKKVEVEEVTTEEISHNEYGLVAFLITSFVLERL